MTYQKHLKLHTSFKNPFWLACKISTLVEHNDYKETNFRVDLILPFPHFLHKAATETT